MIFDSEEQRDFIYDAIRKAVGWSYEEVMRKSQQFGTGLQEAAIIPLDRQKEAFATEFSGAKAPASESGNGNKEPAADEVWKKRQDSNKKAGKSG